MTNSHDWKNLSQFLDTLKASPEWRKALYLIPVEDETIWTTSDAYSVAALRTPQISPKAIVVPEALPLLKQLSERPEAEIDILRGNIRLKWDEKVPEPPVELEDGTVIRQPPRLEAHEAVFEAREATDADPNPYRWLEFFKKEPVRKTCALGVTSRELKRLSALKQGEVKSRPEPAVIQFVQHEGAFTFRLPYSPLGLEGAITTNTMYTGDEQ